MRAFSPGGWACDRARQAVSLGLDSELSQLERVLLERHLDRCAACAEFAADLAALTHELREVAFVPLERPMTLPLRRRAGYGLRYAGAWVAATAVAATALFAVLTPPAQRIETSLPRTGSAVANQDLTEFRELRRAQLRAFPFIYASSAHGPQVDS